MTGTQKAIVRETTLGSKEHARLGTQAHKSYKNMQAERTLTSKADAFQK